MSNVLSSVTYDNGRIYPKLDDNLPGHIGRGIRAYKGLGRIFALSGSIKVDATIGANKKLETIYLNKRSCFKFQKAGKVNKSFFKFMLQNDAKIMNDLEEARNYFILNNLPLGPRAQ